MRHRRTTKLKRRKEPTAARSRGPSAADMQEQLDRLTRELAQAREQQSATSEVLRVISSSPSELEPIFAAILANGTRLCEAKFGTLLLYRDAFHRTPPAQIRTCGFPAYGLYGAFLVKGASRHFCRALLLHSLFDPRREHSFVPTAYYRRRRAQ